MEEKNGIKGREDLVKLQRRLISNSEEIHISRIPKSTKKEFIELANKDFSGDYGMTLKWLMDDLISADSRIFIEELNGLKDRVTFLEEALASATKSNEEEPKKEGVIKTLDGKEKKVGK